MWGGTQSDVKNGRFTARIIPGAYGIKSDQTGQCEFGTKFAIKNSFGTELISFSIFSHFFFQFYFGTERIFWHPVNAVSFFCCPPHFHTLKRESIIFSAHPYKQKCQIW